MAARLPARTDQAPALRQSVLCIEPAAAGEARALHAFLCRGRACRRSSGCCHFRSPPTSTPGSSARGGHLSSARWSSARRSTSLRMPPVPAEDVSDHVGARLAGTGGGAARRFQPTWSRSTSSGRAPIRCRTPGRCSAAMARSSPAGWSSSKAITPGCSRCIPPTAHRGQRLGRAVVAALLAEAMRHGARFAYLQVTADNVAGAGASTATSGS